MKYLFSVLLVIITIKTYAQDLPINPATQLVSVRDSVHLPGLTPADLKNKLLQWRVGLADKNMTDPIFGIKSEEKIIRVGFNSSFFADNTSTTPDHFSTTGSMNYQFDHAEPFPAGLDQPDWPVGSVTFALVYSFTNNQFVYEFTRFEFTGGGSAGKFEDAKPIRPFGIGLLAQNKKRWNDVRSTYYAWFTSLSNNLKQVVAVK